MSQLSVWHNLHLISIGQLKQLNFIIFCVCLSLVIVKILFYSNWETKSDESKSDFELFTVGNRGTHQRDVKETELLQKISTIIICCFTFSRLLSDSFHVGKMNIVLF